MNIRPWGDLPQDILGFIFGKSTDAVDAIRFRAVCKNWRYADLPFSRPWLCNLSWSKGRVKFELDDPDSYDIWFIWKHVKSRCRYTRSHSSNITCFGSSQGWLIAGYPSLGFITKWAIFICNPYNKRFISLPSLKCDHPMFATFSGNRVFLFSCRENCYGGYVNYIASYFLNGERAKKKEWRIVCVGDTRVVCRGFQFVKEKEKLLCLFSDGIMRSYSLSSSSQEEYLTLVSLGEGSHRLAERDQRLWLAKGDGDLLVACELDDSNGDEWSTFYFDWPSMRWMASDLRVINAVCVAVDLSTCVGQRRSADCDHRVYLVREGEHSNYFVEEMRNVGGVYGLDTVFIEPPRIRRCLQTLY